LRLIQHEIRQQSPQKPNLDTLLAHIGVDKWLEENNFRIKSIVGCSIGSLIGGVYAAGELDQLESGCFQQTN
jgi:hypothetical protein